MRRRPSQQRVKWPKCTNCTQQTLGDASQERDGSDPFLASIWRWPFDAEASAIRPSVESRRERVVSLVRCIRWEKPAAFTIAKGSSLGKETGRRDAAPATSIRTNGRMPPAAVKIFRTAPKESSCVGMQLRSQPTQPTNQPTNQRHSPAPPPLSLALRNSVAPHLRTLTARLDTSAWLGLARLGSSRFLCSTFTHRNV